MTKVIFLIALITAVFTGNAQVKVLPDITKSQLVEFIEDATKEGKLSEGFLIILDEITSIDLEEMREDERFFGKILIIKKGNEKITEIYGAQAINGVVMLESVPKTPEGEEVRVANKKVLYFLKGKEVSQEYLQKINPDSVKSVRVINSKEEIARYTDKECDGIIVIDAAVRN